MSQIILQIPSVGSPNSTEDPKIATDLSTVQTAINGGLDATNLSTSAAQLVGVNLSGQTVKGASIVSTGQSITSTSYTTLPTPDQVPNVTLASTGLLAVWFQAVWQESVQGAARAAIFVGGNQLKGSPTVGAVPVVQETAVAGSGGNPVAGTNNVLATIGSALGSTGDTTSYSGDVTTGQAIGVGGASGGPCYIFAAAGQYTVSVQFKASSGSVTVSLRRLYVQALTFS